MGRSRLADEYEDVREDAYGARRARSRGWDDVEAVATIGAPSALESLLYGTGELARESTSWAMAQAELDARIAADGLDALSPSPMTLAARAAARELVYGPDPEADLPRDERTEAWERAAELGSMPERMLQREVKIHVAGGGSGGGGSSKKKPKPKPDAAAVNVPNLDRPPYRPLFVRATIGTRFFFDTRIDQRGEDVVSQYVMTALLTKTFPVRSQEETTALKRVRRPAVLAFYRLPPIRITIDKVEHTYSCDDVADLARKRPIEVAEALRMHAYARGGERIWRLDGFDAPPEAMQQRFHAA